MSAGHRDERNGQLAGSDRGPADVTDGTDTRVGPTPAA